MSAPVKKFQAGGVQVAVWENDSPKGNNLKFNTVSIERRYKSKDDQWKSTSSMNVNDIPKAILSLQKAYEYLALKDSDYAESTNGNGTPTITQASASA